MCSLRAPVHQISYDATSPRSTAESFRILSISELLLFRTIWHGLFARRALARCTQRGVWEIERSCNVKQMKCFDTMQREPSSMRGIRTMNVGGNYLLPLKKKYDRLQHKINMFSSTHTHIAPSPPSSPIPIERNQVTQYFLPARFVCGIPVADMRSHVD